jgi:hypothetical protein
MGFSRRKIKVGVQNWNSGGKNSLLLLRAIPPYEEILFLAAGRASSNYVRVYAPCKREEKSGMRKAD